MTLNYCTGQPDIEPAQPAERQGEAVAYLDVGTVGYLDLGTDLSIEQLQALPTGRHMLGIIGTFGANGYTHPAPAPAPTQQPLSKEQTKFIKFLNGEAAWDGYWFGDERPDVPGRFWWRKDMRRLFPAHGIGGEK